MSSGTIRDAFDKSPYRSIKYSSYFAVYQKFFADFRGQPITFVEIGVLDGGSLFMWREFFGPQARIIGVDLNPAAKQWQDHGFEIFIGNQADPGFWQDFVEQVGAVDIVLDDGGHTFEQQIVTVEALLPIVADGGLLMVEDTHTSYDADFGGPSRFSFVEYAKNRTDGINYRSSYLGEREADRQAWGISFFESFVIFHVDRRESEARVEFVANAGEGRDAADHRHADSRILGRFGKVIDRFPALAKVGPVKSLRSIGSKAMRRMESFDRNRRLGRFFRF